MIQLELCNFYNDIYVRYIYEYKLQIDINIREMKFVVNDVVFVRGIGYGIVVQGGGKKEEQKTELDSMKRSLSFCFDPELFNSDPEGKQKKLKVLSENKIVVEANKENQQIIKKQAKEGNQIIENKVDVNEIKKENDVKQFKEIKQLPQENQQKQVKQDIKNDQPKQAKQQIVAKQVKEEKNVQQPKQVNQLKNQKQPKDEKDAKELNEKKQVKSNKDHKEQKIRKRNESKELRSQQKLQQIKKTQKSIQTMIQVRLDGTQAIIYTLQSNITKQILVQVKPFAPRGGMILLIEVQVTKTIQNLKKTILQLLGNTPSNYYNIKLFTTNPFFNELNVSNKTIAQMQIKDRNKLILTANCALTFRNPINPENSKYIVSVINNGFTLQSVKVQAIVPLFEQNQKDQTTMKQIKQKIQSQTESLKKITLNELKNKMKKQIKQAQEGAKNNKKQIIQAPIVKPNQQAQKKQLQANKINVPLQKNQAKPQVLFVNKQMVQKIQDVAQYIKQALQVVQPNAQNKQQVKNVQKQPQVIKGQKAGQIQSSDKKNGQKKIKKDLAKKIKQHFKPIVENATDTSVSVLCNISFVAGKHYWQIKMQKLPIKGKRLVIGVQFEDVIWGYEPTTGKKVFIRGKQSELKEAIEQKGINQVAKEEKIMDYGLSLKVNENVGVFLLIRKKEAKIVFYKAGVSQGLAFEYHMTKEAIEFTPIVMIGGEAQVIIDSKVDFPLDSYRYL